MTKFNSQEIKLTIKTSRINNLLKSTKNSHNSLKYLREVTYSDVIKFAMTNRKLRDSLET